MILLDNANGDSETEGLWESLRSREASAVSASTIQAGLSRDINGQWHVGDLRSEL